MGGSSLRVLAGSIPYANSGTIAPQTLVYATSNVIDVYYAGSTASIEDQIDIYDINTGWDSGLILDNRTSAFGAETVLGGAAGEINAGDQLIFYIDSPDGHFASIASDSPDGINHAYITDTQGGTVHGVLFPAGLYVGMEDWPLGKSDLNYNDDDFLVTGVVDTTPEPAALALFATGLLVLMGGISVRQRANRKVAVVPDGS